MAEMASVHLVFRALCLLLSFCEKFSCPTGGLGNSDTFVCTMLHPDRLYEERGRHGKG